MYLPYYAPLTVIPTPYFLPLCKTANPSEHTENSSAKWLYIKQSYMTHTAHAASTITREHFCKQWEKVHWSPSQRTMILSYKNEACHVEYCCSPSSKCHCFTDKCSSYTDNQLFFWDELPVMQFIFIFLYLLIQWIININYMWDEEWCRNQGTQSPPFSKAHSMTEQIIPK